MSDYPRDEFDDVPEDGTRQGTHRGFNPKAHSGSRAHFLATVLVGVLSLVLGAVCFVNAPRAAQAQPPTATAAAAPAGHVEPPAA